MSRGRTSHTRLGTYNLYEWRTLALDGCWSKPRTVSPVVFAIAFVVVMLSILFQACS